jgi:hypothetical protein
MVAGRRSDIHGIDPGVFDHGPGIVGEMRNAVTARKICRARGLAASR